MDDLHDWASHLIKVEKHIRELNDKLLHKNHVGIEDHVQAIKDHLDKTLAWVNENREQ